MKRLELIEIPGHVGLLALGQEWMTDAHYADIMTACYLGLDISDDNTEIRALAQRGIDLMNAEDKNYDEIRHVIGTVIQWISTQSNIKIYNATVQRLKKLDEQKRIS
jgi:hypothetical protein